MIKAMLYEKVVALCASMDFGKGLGRSEPWGDSRWSLGGGRRLWRQESVFRTFRKKLQEKKRIGVYNRSWGVRTSSLSYHRRQQYAEALSQEYFVKRAVGGRAVVLW